MGGSISAITIKANVIKALGVIANGVRSAVDALYKWVYGYMRDSNGSVLYDSEGKALLCKHHLEKEK